MGGSPTSAPHPPENLEDRSRPRDGFPEVCKARAAEGPPAAAGAAGRGFALEEPPGDKDLLDLAEYRSIPILTAANALQRIDAVKP